jgi:Protein of unknown function (DUF3293)
MTTGGHGGGGHGGRAGEDPQIVADEIWAGYTTTLVSVFVDGADAEPMRLRLHGVGRDGPDGPDGPNLGPVGGADRFPFPGEVVHLVTAHNPMSEYLPAEANDARHRELAVVVADAGWTAVPCTGQSTRDGVTPDGEWREEGLAIRGLSRAEAVELGRRFGQRSIFEWTPAAMVLVPCTPDDELTVLGWATVD